MHLKLWGIELKGVVGRLQLLRRDFDHIGIPIFRLDPVVCRFTRAEWVFGVFYIDRAKLCYTMRFGHLYWLPVSWFAGQRCTWEHCITCNKLENRVNLCWIKYGYKLQLSIQNGLQRVSHLKIALSSIEFKTKTL